MFRRKDRVGGPQETLLPHLYNTLATFMQPTAGVQAELAAQLVRSSPARSPCLHRGQGKGKSELPIEEHQTA